MKLRSLSGIYPSVKVNMGGIILDQPLPRRDLDMLDPFLLIHHWDDRLPGGQEQRNLGVGPHPHRGFTPVSFIFNGGVHHRDSRGHESIIYGGGTQWMNSGFGIVHSERPAKELAEVGGRFELIQFWINAPAKHKMDEASYQPLTAEQTPTVVSSDGNMRVGVVAGSLLGKKGPITTHSPLLTLRIEAHAGEAMDLPIPSDYNTLLYVLDGQLKVNDTQTLSKRELAILNLDGEGIRVQAMEDTRAILLSGQPIGEPVVSYGPFVMNSQQEIMEAIRDYQMGKLGELDENFG
jgi:redox-sensitive bicupin YhaK (pirin superfamily)